MTMTLVARLLSRRLVQCLQHTNTNRILRHDVRSGIMSIANDKLILIFLRLIEAGRTELSPVAFNLPRLLKDLAAMFRLRAQANALQFDMVVDGELAAYVVADEGKIRQALINLLGNAIKFTDRGQVSLHVALDQRNADRLWLLSTG